MTAYRILKPRPPGSTYDAITKAIGQIPGGLSSAAEAIDRPRASLHAAGDPDTPQRKRVNLTFKEACRLAEVGGYALAEHLALAAGGVFVPLAVSTDAALNETVGEISKENGEAVCEIIQRLADGTFDVTDCRAAIPKIDDALRPLLVARAICLKEIG